MPTRNPLTMTRVPNDRDTNSVGLFNGDHSAKEAKPQCPRRSSKCRAVNERLTIVARIQANMTETNTARMNAASPGSKLANLVRKWAVESAKACLTCCHIMTSDTVRTKTRG